MSKPTTASNDKELGSTTDKDMAALVGDLAMLVRRLVRSLKKTDPDNELARQALDYLLHRGLTSPLRATQPGAVTTRDLINAIRTVNHGPKHAILVPGDDEPCYPQREEWVQWLLTLADEAELALDPPASTTEAADAVAGTGEAQCTCLACIKRNDLRSEGGLPLSMTRMIVCPVCGDKRCLHAKNHEVPCAKTDIYAHNAWIEQHMKTTDIQNGQ